MPSLVGQLGSSVQLAFPVSCGGIAVVYAGWVCVFTQAHQHWIQLLCGVGSAVVAQSVAFSRLPQRVVFQTALLRRHPRFLAHLSVYLAQSAQHWGFIVWHMAPKPCPNPQSGPVSRHGVLGTVVVSGNSWKQWEVQNQGQVVARAWSF
jgi:hypothetical protein